MTNFGERLRHVREAQGWSQEKLGFEVDVTKATVSKWELNQSEPRLKHLARLRQLFGDSGMTLDWLIDDAVSIKNIAKAFRISEGGTPADYVSSPRLVQTSEELSLLVRFRRLSRRKRRAVVELITEPEVAGPLED